MRVSSAWSSVAPAVAMLCWACESRQTPAVPAVTGQVIEIATALPFDSVYCPVDSVLLEQNATHVIAAVQNVVRLDDGSFLLTDDSEGNVKLYGEDGRLERVFGSKGQGPGEFLSPAFAHATINDEIAVADPRLNRIQFFERGGRLARSVLIREFGRIRGFGSNSGGMFFLVAGSTDTASVLVSTDWDGNVRGRSLEIATIRPPGSADDPGWQWARNFFMDVVGDTAYVVASVVPYLWKVDLRTGAIDTLILKPHNYAAPELPDPETLQRANVDLMGWFFTKHLVGFVVSASGSTAIPMIKGWPWRPGADISLIIQSVSGEWRQVENAPMPIDFVGDFLHAVRDPALDSMRVITFAQNCER